MQWSEDGAWAQPAHLADGAWPGQGKGDEGQLVTSNRDAHSPAMLQLQGEVEECSSASSWNILPDKMRRTKACLALLIFTPARTQSAFPCGNLWLYFITPDQGPLSLQSGYDRKPRPTIRVSREIGNLFWKLPLSLAFHPPPHLPSPPKGLFSC